MYSRYLFKLIFVEYTQMYKWDFYIVYSKFVGSQHGIYIVGFKINFVRMKTSLSAVQLIKICPIVQQKLQHHRHCTLNILRIDEWPLI